MKLVVDSSALVAILLVEPDAVQVAIKLATASECVMSTNSYLETALVIVSRGIALKHLDDLIKKSRIKRISMSGAQADVAVAAITRYGKGYSNKAKLNMGDFHSYALAKVRGWPLVFVGDDFTHTDLEAA